MSFKIIFILLHCKQFQLASMYFNQFQLTFTHTVLFVGKSYFTNFSTF